MQVNKECDLPIDWLIPQKWPLGEIFCLPRTLLLRLAILGEPGSLSQFKLMEKKDMVRSPAVGVGWEAPPRFIGAKGSLACVGINIPPQSCSYHSRKFNSSTKKMIYEGLGGRHKCRWTQQEAASTKHAKYDHQESKMEDKTSFL